MKNTDDTPEMRLCRGQMLEIVPHAAVAWRVQRGMLLIHSAEQHTEPAWRLALPGDWLNIEALCGLPQDTQATALIPSRLQAMPVPPHHARTEWLTRVVHQQRQWAHNMLVLRSGRVEQRIRHLLHLLRQAVGAQGLATVPDMPVLRDIATLVDATPETACRVLARLQPSPPPKRTPRSRTAGLLAGCAVALLSGNALAADTTPAAQLQHWSAQAGSPGNAARGQQFFSAKHGGEWSCASCHGTPPTAQGQHANTGKPIAPLAPAFNAKAFTDSAKVNKWFKRNCNDVLSRECSAAEKADVLAYLNSLK